MRKFINFIRIIVHGAMFIMLSMFIGLLFTFSVFYLFGETFHHYNFLFISSSILILLFILLEILD